MQSARPLVIWRFCDGNRAHEKQSAALIEGIEAIRPVSVHDIRVPYRSLRNIQALHSQIKNMPVAFTHPNLMIAAGHRTHAPLLIAKNRFKIPAVVVMKPTVPTKLFDAVIMPEHDINTAAVRRNKVVPISDKVIISNGVLNPSIASHPQDKHGLILLGGKNRYFAWDWPKVIDQIESIVETAPSDVHWHVSNSRRTPSFRELEDFASSYTNVSVYDWQDIPSRWLPEQLSQAETIWVTTDSLSMIFEALNTRARVGVLTLNPLKDSKVTESVDRLVEQDLVATYDQWKVDERLPHRQTPLNDHLRCAELLLKQLSLA